MVSRLYKSSDSLCTDLESCNLIALPVNIIAHLVVFWPEILADVGEEAFVLQVGEEGVRREGLPVDVDGHRYPQLGRQTLHKLNQPRHRHLVVIDQTLIDLFADFWRQVILRLKPFQEHYFRLQISIRLIKRGQDGGQAT